MASSRDTAQQIQSLVAQTREEEKKATERALEKLRHEFDASQALVQEKEKEFNQLRSKYEVQLMLKKREKKKRERTKFSFFFFF